MNMILIGGQQVVNVFAARTYFIPYTYRCIIHKEIFNLYPPKIDTRTIFHQKPTLKFKIEVFFYYNTRVHTQK